MNSLRARLAASSDLTFSLYASTAAFSTYFCMYAFRKPFSAGTFEGLTFLGTAIELKTAFALSQLVGYTLSKYLGIRICSERVGEGRAKLLIQLIGFAFVALLLFAVLPTQWKWIGLFLNGLPLGMVWGVCVSYLEGRKTSDALLAGLACSFIVASGVVKDVARWLMADHGVSEFWMPAATGGLFILPFLLSVWLLTQLPPPTPEDELARCKRVPMDQAARWDFIRRFAFGLTLLIFAYMMLTAFRDFRDIYQAELFQELQLADQKAIFSRSEITVAVVVMVVMALLNLVRGNRRGFFAAYGVMTFGFALIGLVTLGLENGQIGGMAWMIGTGLGSYLAYVPYNTLLFERMIAYTRFSGTAVFAIYLADASGYTGAAALQLYKDLVAGESTRLEFFSSFCYGVSILGLILMAVSWIYFGKQKQSSDAVS